MNIIYLMTIASTVVTGLMAGLYLGWAISVLPGLSLLPDTQYLNAFQKMNRAILNTRFKTLFFSALVLPPVTAAASIWWYGFPASFTLTLSSLLLLVGHGGITIFGNIPINEELNQMDLVDAASESLTFQRRMFEQKWYAWHWSRTAATGTAFILLLTVQS